MKKISKYIILILCVSIVFLSCKKKNQFNLSEITETDYNGNLVGNINPNDWKLLRINEAIGFDKSVLDNIESSGTFNISKFNYNCTKPDTFELVAYPNPINKNSIGQCNLNFKLNADAYFYNSNAIKIVLVKKNGDIIMSTNVPLLENGTWRVETYSFTDRDFICYSFFITQDSCLFYTKGNVIGCEYKMN